MEDFVPFEIAQKLKEKGFREKCLCYYIDINLVYNIESPVANNQLWFCHNKYDDIWHRDNIDAPTISQVLKWLREEKKVYIGITYMPKIITKDKVFTDFYYPTIQKIGIFESMKFYNTENYKTYEEAAIAGIEHVFGNMI